MKTLSAGLTLVNFAAVSALLLGMATGGLRPWIAVVALLLGVAGAVLAFRGTSDLPAPEPDQVDASSEGVGRPFCRAWFWPLAAVFGFFAFRAFCWLLYSDGSQLKVQSINNLGDLSLHLTYIRNFASGVALWPDNPIHPFSHLRYPAGVDLCNALLLLLRLDLTHGLIWAGLIASVAAFYALYRWGGSFTVAGFLFNGGIVGFQFLQTGKLLDYQGVSSIAWKSLPLAMFVTQRGLLYALPAGLLLLCHWRGKYFPPANAEGARVAPRSLLPFWLELSLYATLPLFHVHTFLALSLVAAFLFLIGGTEAHRLLATLVAAAFVPATLLLWTITDHFQARSMLAWQPGWVQNKGDFAAPFLQFWFVNFGIFLPLVLVLLGVYIWRVMQSDARFTWRAYPGMAFALPAVLLFVFACLVKTAPWEWDNIKLIFWAYLIVLPFLWRDLLARWPEPLRVGLCFALFTSGFFSLFGGLTGKENGYGIADRAEVEAVGNAVRKLPVEARFAAWPTYNHPLLLQGRKVVLGYPGHLWTQGFDYGAIEGKLNGLMRGEPQWRENARYLGVRYLFWGREEKANYGGSTRPWEQETKPIASGAWGAIYDLAAPVG